MAAMTILSRLAAAMPRSIAYRPESMKSAESSARNVVPLPPGPNRRDKHELAFLPAALEIVETPPSPIGRAIGVTIIALFGLALAWAAPGEGEHLAAAPGKNHPEWAHQSHPAVRDRRRAGHPRPRRAERQGWASPDRARSDHERGRTQPFAQRPYLGAARRRPLARRFERQGRSSIGVSSARSRAPEPSGDAAPIPGGSDIGICSQARGAGAPTRAEGGR